MKFLLSVFAQAQHGKSVPFILKNEKLEKSGNDTKDITRSFKSYSDSEDSAASDSEDSEAWLSVLFSSFKQIMIV